MAPSRHESEYKGWKIRVTPEQTPKEGWRVKIEVWEPGGGPHTRPPFIVPITQRFDSEEGSLAGGREPAARWVEKNK